MKILQVHNEYVYPGGEDVVAASEAALLRSLGHQVVEYRRSNTEMLKASLFKKAGFYFSDIYFSRQSYADVRYLIAAERPDIAHFHNTFFMLTASAYAACYDAGLPIVQSLHNYRIMCPIGVFFRGGRVCEDCVAKGFWRCVAGRCWRDSYLKSFLLARVVFSFRKDGIFEKKVSAFSCPSRFCKDKYLRYGLPEEKIFLKPNFISDVFCPPAEAERNYAVYAGALRDYKGVRTLIRVWENLEERFSLKVIGDGPLKEELVRSARGLPVEFPGQKSLEETLEIIKNAAFLILPSECYENFPRVVVEAYSLGVPVIASRIGALAEIVEDGKTGLTFMPGDAEDLRDKIECLVADPDAVIRMGKNARKFAEEHFNSEKYYQELMNVYQMAVEKHAQRVG